MTAEGEAEARAGLERLILHVGAHKTASSMLQTALKHVRRPLEQQGMQVISRSAIKSTPFHATLQNIASLKNVEADASVGREVAEMVRPSARTLLLTSEDLLSRINLKYCFRAPEAGLRLIRAVFPQVATKVILYVRSQADYIESTYTQHIHTGHNISFEDYLGDELPTHIQWDVIADRIASVVGPENLSVAPYEMIFAMGAEGFFRDFLRRAELPDPAQIPFEEPSGRSSNRSYSALAVDIWRRVEPLLETPMQKKKFRSYLQAEFSTATMPKARWLTPEQREAVGTIYRGSNIRLFAEYMPEHDPADLHYV